jgi:predicted transcriptional regulator
MSPYRDRVYIIKDIIVKLVDYGSLNQTSLISFCGLNLKKHRSILFELELNELVTRSEITSGHRTITVYKPTQKGIEFCNKIIEPYEKMFPRQRQQGKSEIPVPFESRIIQEEFKTASPVKNDHDSSIRTDHKSIITIREMTIH